MIADMDRKFIHEQQKLSEDEFESLMKLCDAVEMNWNTYQKLKKEINDTQHSALFLYLFATMVIFIDDELKDGEIHLGIRSEILKKEKYASVTAKLTRSLREEVRK